MIFCYDFFEFLLNAVVASCVPACAENGDVSCQCYSNCWYRMAGSIVGLVQCMVWQQAVGHCTANVYYALVLTFQRAYDPVGFVMFRILLVSRFFLDFEVSG